jgi:hypothetical protein
MLFVWWGECKRKREKSGREKKEKKGECVSYDSKYFGREVKGQKMK